ncbi:protein of unknown function DUF35 [Pyrolobus fumarii 1A]|uniref:DUF35 domain-containing protein n=1 Tax=Pyrolobus fumarii (strain DSM 11204 / 1A) TaxID=694429 RepID=G0ED07_PYRF1|nr:Zn-ribbon domain-containing OB-fold protein [Pyrolobus fumarii]AEM38566.1 protein of unknown function DUF35 [Pyrolobus fumarii 1A]
MKPLITPAKVWRLKESHYRLVGGKCTSCGFTFFPKSPRCPRCGSRSVEPYTLPREAVVESYTLVYQVPEYMRDQAPLSFALLRLTDGTRIAAALTEVDASSLRSGVKVEAVFRRVLVDGQYGVIAYGTKWRPQRLQKG